MRIIFRDPACPHPANYTTYEEFAEAFAEWTQFPLKRKSKDGKYAFGITNAAGKKVYGDQAQKLWDAQQKGKGTPSLKSRIKDTALSAAKAVTQKLGLAKSKEGHEKDAEHWEKAVVNNMRRAKEAEEAYSRTNSPYDKGQIDHFNQAAKDAAKAAKMSRAAAKGGGSLLGHQQASDIKSDRRS